MEALAVLGLLLNVLSLGRFAQWTVRVSAKDFIYVTSDGEELVPKLCVEVCNVGRVGITLHPLEYRTMQKFETSKPFDVAQWKEPDSCEQVANARLESGEMRTCETRLPLVHPKEAAMLVEVIVKTHCGKRARRIVKNHSLKLNDKEIILLDGRDIEEYLRDEFPNYPI